MVLEEPQVYSTLVNETESVESTYPSKCQYYFKYESEQPSGSFKLRGVGHFIKKEITRSKAEGYNEVRVFSSSGGNAGLAAAYASRHYGIECTVVLPKSAKPLVVEQLKAYGAHVIIHGEHWGEANAFLNEYAKKEESNGQYPILCHPFDHPKLWEGHGSLVDEVVEQLGEEKVRKLKGFVCSVGGGGLYCGVVNGLKRNNLNSVPVLAVETEPAPTFSKAIEAKKVVMLESVRTIATSLASPYIASQALENYSSHPTKVELLADSDAVKGTIDYYQLFNKVVEPACGATLVTAFSRSDLLEQHFGPLEKDDIVVFVVCGGSVYSEEDVKKLIETSV